MRRKVVITPSSFAQVSSKPLEKLREYFDDIIINNTGKKIPNSDVVDFYDNAQYSIAGLEDLNSDILSYLPNLKVISRVGIGLDNIDLEYASQNNIKVLNTPDPPTDAVAEMTITAALSLSRNLIHYNKDLHMKHWNKSVSNSLKNKNIFIIGFGRIGQKVGKYFNFFGSEVCYYDPYIESKNIDNIFKKIEFKKGLIDADIISIHSNSKSELLGNAEFKLMKDNVIILNSSRGYHTGGTDEQQGVQYFSCQYTPCRTQILKSAPSCRSCRTNAPTQQELPRSLCRCLLPLVGLLPAPKQGLLRLFFVRIPPRLRPLSTWNDQR